MKECLTAGFLVLVGAGLASLISQVPAYVAGPFIGFFLMALTVSLGLAAFGSGYLVYRLLSALRLLP